MLKFILFCQQGLCTAVTPFRRLRALNTATVTPGQNHLLVQATQVPAVIVTASPIDYRHIPSSLRGRKGTARPSRPLRCGSWNEHTDGSHT